MEVKGQEANAGILAVIIITIIIAILIMGLTYIMISRT